jgi:serine phosphatase RsbU (regulator of sigma subunit)/catechol 2,3-dioxygenase-like lactoylglutathione lyase family enzyme
VAGISSEAVPDSFLGIHAVNVYVRDQERSLRFYVDTLGFHVAFDGHRESGQRLVAVTPPDGTSVLALVQPEPGSPHSQLIGRSTHVTLLTDDVPGRYREWRQRGVRFRKTPRLRRVVYEPVASSGPNVQAGPPVWGGVFTRFEDLDGNCFELVSFDEVSRAIESQRRAAAEKQEADRRTRQELSIAKQVQARLFPQSQPPLQSLEYAGACVQSRQVGGDYYDFLELGQERLGLVVGDIMGKGIAAALLMANLQANLRSQCAIAVEEPERLLRSVNRLFSQNTDEHAYATLFYSEFDDRTRRLRYANCGHLAGLLLHEDGTVEHLDSTAPVVGLFAGWECSTAERQLVPGDLLTIYTDGITESFNQQDEEFGEPRLIRALQQYRALSPAEAIAAVLDDVARFSLEEQSDDRTLIVAKCRGDER